MQRDTLDDSKLDKMEQDPVEMRIKAAIKEFEDMIRDKDVDMVTIRSKRTAPLIIFLI